MTDLYEQQDQKLFSIREISFLEILPIWRNELWPQRQSLIEPISIIDHEGRLGLKPEELRLVAFWGAFQINPPSLVGVISSFPTSSERVRCRGLWVKPDLRHQGIGKAFIFHVVQQAAIRWQRSILWTMPRASSVSFYLNCGFSIYGKTNEYEFGPHYLAEKDISEFRLKK